MQRRRLKVWIWKDAEGWRNQVDGRGERVWGPYLYRGYARDTARNRFPDRPKDGFEYVDGKPPGGVAARKTRPK
jgi:hypothetical protein